MSSRSHRKPRRNRTTNLRSFLRGGWTFRPLMEVLERRYALATITVTTVTDDLTPNDGTVSLREAITAMNAGNDLGDPNITAQSPGAFGTSDTINFNIPGSSPHTIV